MGIFKFEIERLEELSGRLGISAYELTLRTRERAVLEKRQVVMWYLIEHDRWSTTRVGNVTGYNHGTVIHARDKVKSLLSVGDKFMSELKKQITHEDK